MDTFIKQRRSLMLISLIIFFFFYGKMTITKISILGNSATVGHSSAIVLFLWVSWLYWWGRYLNSYLEIFGNTGFFNHAMAKFDDKNEKIALIELEEKFSQPHDYQIQVSEIGRIGTNSEIKGSILYGKNELKILDLFCKEFNYKIKYKKVHPDPKADVHDLFETIPIPKLKKIYNAGVAILNSLFLRRYFLEYVIPCIIGLMPLIYISKIAELYRTL